MAVDSPAIGVPAEGAAVGEKNNAEGSVGTWLARAPPSCLPLAERGSKDRAEPSGACEYKPLEGFESGFDIHPVGPLESPMTEASAAFLTELLIEYATIARQASTQNPKNPSTAPTTMKTVPSGRDDFCINGASAVYGTTMVGIPAPATVGALVSLNTEFVAVPLVEDASGNVAVVATEEPPELAADVAEDCPFVDAAEEAALEEAADEADVDAAEVVCVVLPVIVARSGRFVVAGSATASALTNETRASRSRPAVAAFIRLCGRILIVLHRLVVFVFYFQALSKSR